MSEDSPVWALGLMSGTSLDGVDAALIKTDGRTVQEFGPWITLPMPGGLRDRLRKAMAGEGDILQLERDVTVLHAEAVAELLCNAELDAASIAVVGFHGQTIAHRPQEGLTWQIGNGALLANKTGIDVVCDFRRADMAAGGQGAPLVPLFHAAVMASQPKPVAVLNIGGVANVTWIGGDSAFDLLAFDTGPGNVMLNEWCLERTDAAYDKGGKYAQAGRVHERLVQVFLRDDYFNAQPPKSLDRNHFSLTPFNALSLEDGAATLNACMAASVARSLPYFTQAPTRWFICGGGRHNPAIMRRLRESLGCSVEPVEKIGLQGDAMEAQAFAYLAVRSLRGLPLTLPSTTGVKRASGGGAFYRANTAGEG